MNLDEEFTLNSVSSESENIYSLEGFTTDALLQRIAVKNKIVIDKDEPTLIQLTILEAFVEEFSKANEKNNIAIRNIYREQTLIFQKEIELARSTMRSALLDISQESLTTLFGKHLVEMANLKSLLSFCSAIIALSAIIHVALFIIQ